MHLWQDGNRPTGLRRHSKVLGSPLKNCYKPVTLTKHCDIYKIGANVISKGCEASKFFCMIPTTMCYWLPLTKLDRQKLGVMNIPQQLEQAPCLAHKHLITTHSLPDLKSRQQLCMAATRTRVSGTGTDANFKGSRKRSSSSAEHSDRCWFSSWFQTYPNFPAEGSARVSPPPGRRSITQPPQSKHCI